MHAILVIKDRRSLISSELEKRFFAQIIHQVEKCDSKVLAINRWTDHIHVLISLSPKISFSDVIKQIKGSTSYWVNSNDLIVKKFSWQKGPRGFSISQSRLNQTISYINSQKEKPKIVGFAEEFKKILMLHGLGE